MLSIEVRGIMLLGMVAWQTNIGDNEGLGEEGNFRPVATQLLGVTQSTQLLRVRLSESVHVVHSPFLLNALSDMHAQQKFKVETTGQVKNKI
jgi:hypothetical protein